MDLHKLKTNDQNRKGAELRGWCFSLVEIKLYKIKSYKVITGALKEVKRSGTNFIFGQIPILEP
jgi:hypothetical protein